MASLETIRRVVIKVDGVDGIDRLAAAYDRAAEAEQDFATAGGAVATSTDRAEKGVTSVARSFEAYQRSVDPAAKITATFERQAETLRRALSQGLFGEGEAGARAFRMELDRLRTSTDASLAGLARVKAAQDAARVSAGFSAMGAMGRSNLTEIDAARRIAGMGAALATVGTEGAKAAAGIGLAGYQLTNLAYQINDVGTMLASGSSPFQVLATQGGQVYQILSAGEGGVVGSVQGLGASIAGLLTPTTLATGGLLAMGATAGAAAVAWAIEQDRLAASIAGVGRAAGLTVDDLNALADAGAAAAGISGAAARGLVGAMAGTGRIGGDVIGDVVGISRQFGRATGQDLGAAGEMLTSAFASPTRGADALTERLGFLDDATRSLIRSTEASGDVFGAQRVLFDAIESDLATIEDRTWSLARGFENLGRAGSDAFYSVGAGIERAVNGPGIAERLSVLQAELAAVRQGRALDAARVAAETGGMAGADAVPIDERFAAPGAAGAGGVARLLQEVQALQSQIARAREQAAVRGDMAQARRSSIIVGDLIRGTLPELGAQQTLGDQAGLLGGASDSTLSRLGVSADDAARALGALEHARDSYLTADERARLSEDLSVRSIMARTAAERAQIEADRERLQLAGAKITTAEAELRIEAKRLAVLQQTAREAEDRLRAARDSAGLAGMPSYQRSQAEIENRARDARERAMGSPDAMAAVEATRIAELAALEQTAIVRPIMEATRSVREQIDALQLQAETFGKSTEEVERAKAIQSLLNEAARAGIEVTDGLRDAYSGIADAIGEVAAASETLAERQREVVDAMDAVRSTTSSTFGGLVRDLTDGKSAAEAFANVGERLLDRSIDLGADALAEGLFGKAGKPGGGLLGDGLGGLIGNAVGLPAAEAEVARLSAMNIGSATISAASVTVMGYAPAGGGLPGVGGVLGADAAVVPAGVVGDSLVPRNFTMPGGASLPSNIMGPGGDITYGPKWNGAVDPRLLDIVQQAAAGSPYDVRFNSGLRPGDKRFHGRGMAMDVGLLDPVTGSMLDNYQDPSAFRAYEEFAQRARSIQMDQYPDLADDFRWGGYFSGPKGKYGALDSMHFDLAGERVGMGGGSWAGGLTPAQRQTWPGATSIGMGADPSVVVTDAAAAAQAATQSFGELGGALGAATPQAGALGQALAGAFSTPAVPGAGTGGGLFDFFGSLFSSAPALAGGGPVRGPGTGTSDSIPAWLSDGEFIVNAKQARKHRSLLEAINDNTIMAFAAGGEVGRIPGYAMETMRGARGGGGGDRPAVVIEDRRGRGAPKIEQKRERGPSGEEILRFTIRDEIGKSYRPGGLADKDMRRRGSPRPPIER